MADPVQASEHDDVKYLLLSMDYGTKALSVAYRIATLREARQPVNRVKDVSFSRADIEAPQKIALARGGEFYWGHGVTDAMNAEKVTADDVVELWKLQLYKDHEESDMAERVQNQLDRLGLTLQQLIADHLRAITTFIKASISSDERRKFSGIAVDALPVKLFLSVPQMWKEPSNKIMTEAAELAEIEYVELVYEPQCAAACYISEMKQCQPVRLNEGDTFVVADIGGGTGDFVSYKCKSPSHEGAGIALEHVGQAQGALCGSEFVDENFRLWLKDQATTKDRSFMELCEAMGITDVRFLHQASVAFGPYKDMFRAEHKVPLYVAIRGSEGASIPEWKVAVTSDLMRTFFDPVIEKIVECINAQFNASTKLIIISGGFGKSAYLLEKLGSEYNKNRTVIDEFAGSIAVYERANSGPSQHPVSRGALMRFGVLDERAWLSRGSFGVARVEDYNPRVHRDATYVRGQTMSNGRPCRKAHMSNPALVGKDPYDKRRRVVYERWHPILEKGTVCEPGQTFTTETWQQYIVPVKNETISTQIYWTELEMKPSDPILTGFNLMDSDVRQGIERWGDLLELKLPNLEGLGFKSKEVGFKSKEIDDRGHFFEIYVRIALKCDGANITASMQIAMPGTQPYNANNGKRRRSKVQFANENVFELSLSKASHNPSVREMI